MPCRLRRTSVGVSSARASTPLDGRRRATSPPDAMRASGRAAARIGRDRQATSAPDAEVGGRQVDGKARRGSRLDQRIRYRCREPCGGVAPCFGQPGRRPCAACSSTRVGAPALAFGLKPANRSASARARRVGQHFFFAGAVLAQRRVEHAQALDRRRVSRVIGKSSCQSTRSSTTSSASAASPFSRSDSASWPGSRRASSDAVRAASASWSRVPPSLPIDSARSRASVLMRSALATVDRRARSRSTSPGSGAALSISSAACVASSRRRCSSAGSTASSRRAASLARQALQPTAAQSS